MKRLLVCIVLVCSFVLPTAIRAAGDEPPTENSFRYQNGVPIISGPMIGPDMPEAAADGIKGIDVSSHQKIIDWDAVKNSGIEFAIIRCGFGDDFKEYDDEYWERNVSECERLGIPYGVYLYSYAASLFEAESEAAHAIRLLKGHDPAYPVYLDLEDKLVGSCSNELIGQIADVFCSRLQNEGYEVGVYANLNWWNTRLTSSVFENHPSWHKWVAQWSSSCTYGGSYTMWQYTDNGSVSGISGGVDMDIWYGEPRVSKGIPGDIHGDGTADSGDAGMILKFDAGIITLSQEQIKLGDINGDGMTDAGDAGIILRRAAGIDF